MEIGTSELGRKEYKKKQDTIYGNEGSIILQKKKKVLSHLLLSSVCDSPNFGIGNIQNFGVSI